MTIKPAIQTVPDWPAVLAEAEACVRGAGEEPDALRLPPSTHGLDAADVVAALGIGVLGAAIPSLGSRGGLIQDGFKKIQDWADANKLPAFIQAIFGRKPAAFMDEGASGVYHRFLAGHDLVTALPKAIRTLGWLRGPVEVFQHLLTDTFGRTGIPLPGSTTIAAAIANHVGMKSLSDLISGKNLSRYFGLRMTDVVATGTTSLLLWGYGKVRGVPEGSLRRPKLSLLGHGITFLAVAAMTAVPGLRLAFPFRSHLNYVSLVAMAKNAWQLHCGLARIGAAQDELEAVLQGSVDTLARVRAGLADVSRLEAELQRASLLLAN
jgi:hypothetical protein